MGCTAGTGVATALMMLKMNTMALRTNPECNNGLMVSGTRVKMTGRMQALLQPTIWKESR